MISEVVMPQMGADMTEGTVLRWLKYEGDPVTRGEIIAEIETDKANVEIEAFESGVFRKVLAAEGDVVKVGEVIAVIAAADDDISQYAEGAATPKAAPASNGHATRTASAPAVETAAVRPIEASAPALPVEASAPAREGRVRASPLARRIAEERGVDLRQLRGTGPDGRIVKRDVEAAVAPPPPPVVPTAAPYAPPTPEAAPVAMSRMRQTIARRMSQSKREAPHYYLLMDIDMTEAAAFRAQINATQTDDVRVSVNDLIVRACALALQLHPMFNTTITGDEVTRHGVQNVCIGIALDEGLIAPAILDAGRKTLLQIAADAKDLAARAKGGALRPEEITGGTFTISNLGAYGVETLVAIIQPPQTAILGVGAVAPQPAVRDGEVVVRQIMEVALSADHRVTDGAQGAQLLGDIKRLLEQPLLLIL
ncbi:MAG: dihydrolipoamide acetyltransferase family protein [Dehalococcoidia bacterium]